MFVTDVKCPQATWQSVPNSRADSAKASVSKAVVRTWHRAHEEEDRSDRRLPSETRWIKTLTYLLYLFTQVNSALPHKIMVKDGHYRETILSRRSRYVDITTRQNNVDPENKFIFFVR